MNKLAFKSIRTRLTFWFLILALTPLIIGILITFNQQKRLIEQETFNKLTSIRDLKAMQLEQWLDKSLGDLRVMSGDFEIRDLENIFEKKSKSPEDIEKIETARELLNRNLRNFDHYSEIFIIGANTGLVEISTHAGSLGENKSHNIYFTIPLETGEIYIKDIYYSSSTNKPEMTISLPILCLAHNKHIVGILVVRIDLGNSLFKMLLERVGLGKTGEILIVNENVVALNELRWYDNAPLNLQIDSESAINAAQGKTGILVSTDYRGEEILAAYTYIPETGWGFICKQDLSELNAPIREMILDFVILFIISAILIYLAAFFISKTISKPIIGMDVLSKKIKVGDYTVRNVVRSEDELGSLAKSINEMTASIESLITTQKGVSNISEAMIGQSSMQGFGSELLKQLMEITKSNMGTFYILNEANLEFEHFTSVGANEELLKSFSAENPEGEFGNAISQKKIFYLRNIPEDSVFKFRTTAGDLIPKEIITIPILIDNTVVALISLANIQKFSKESYSIFEQSWNAINSSYSNLMASERTSILAESLFKTNQQLEAQTEELQEQSEELQNQTEELQQTSEELQEQNLELDLQSKQVEEANKLKSEFLSNMSHELRTPLNSIMALSRVLMIQAKDKLSEEENNYLEIVERNGRQLRSLINDILDLSKIEAGKMDVNPKFISLNTMLKNIRDSLLPIVQEKDLEFKLDIADDLPEIETDEDKLHQVLQNIISNSVKFTEKGNIDITVNYDSEKVYIYVKDTGIGIPKEALSHIFKEFRQVDGSSSRQYEGTGLGLAIAYKMIKVLGGDIQVKSALDKGSTFTITLPIKWQGEAELLDIKTFQPAIPEPKGETILVVDDDPKFASDISKYFEIAGYSTIKAISGKEALKLAEEHQPFAITLDMIMPEMDGLEVLQRLKSNLKTKDIPVIVVSVTENRDTGFLMGAVGYIQKPVDKSLLIFEINKLKKNPDYVMIVDDNEIDLKQMAEIIKAENINTILAEGGKKCIKLLKEHTPDVLVLDLLMPDMDGFQVLDKIRKDKETRDLPVIVVTAKDLTKEDRAKFKGQVSSVLTKSDSTPQDLFQEVKRIFAGLERSREISESEKKNSETRILIVEDNEATIIQMKAVLENEGYKLDVAVDGKQALEYIKNKIPDGIILDLIMPGIDGFEVLKNIRNTEETKNIPVVVLTAKDLNSEDLSKLRANNIQQLVQKGDVDIDRLLFKIKMALGNAPEFKEKGKRGKEKRKTVKPEKRRKTEMKKQIDGLPRVLVVEDNPDNMATLKAIIGGKYEMLEAGDGKEGLYKVVNEKPDLVLLDISIPKMDGVEVVSIIKESKKTKHIPVIAVTARAMKEDKKTFLNAGCDDYIAKPVDPEIVMKKLKKWLGK